MRLFSPLPLSVLLLSLQGPLLASSCDDTSFEVTIDGGICLDGTFDVKLKDPDGTILKETGTLTGSSCFEYTLISSDALTYDFEPEVEYTLEITANPSESTGNVRTVHINASCTAGCYTLKMKEDGESDFTDTTSIDEQNSTGCDAGDDYIKTHTLVLKSNSSSDDDVSGTTGSCPGSGGGGGGEADPASPQKASPSGGTSSGGLKGTFSVGSSSKESLGNITFGSNSISPELFTTAALRYAATSPDVEVVRDSGGSLRQIKSPEHLIDIVTTSASSYEIRYYPVSRAGAKVGEFYTPSGDPEKIWRISSPDGDAEIPVLKTTKIEGAVQKEETFSSVGGVWMSEIPGVRNEIREENLLANGDLEIKTTVTDATTGAILSETTETRRAFPWGTETISRLRANDRGADHLTSYAFYEDSADADNYGSLKSVVRPDGSWEKYTYWGEYNPTERGFAIGKVKNTFRPWKGLPTTPDSADETNCQLTTQYYRSVNGSTFDVDLGIREVRVLGELVTKEENVFSSGTLSTTDFPVLTDFPDMHGLAVSIRKAASSPTPEGTSPKILPSGPFNESATIAPAASVPEYLRGRTAYTRSPDGRLSVHSYEIGEYDSNTNAFTPSATGTFIREAITQGTTEETTGIAGRTTRTLRVISPVGKTVTEETQIKTASGFASVETTVHSYDEQCRRLTTTRNGRLISENTYLNGRLDTTTDEQGITTTYLEYDIEGRATKMTRLGVTTDIVYDALGRRESSTRSAGGLSLTSSSEYDMLGRVFSSTSEQGLTTTTDYSEGGRITTVTSPSTATRTTTNYLDGQTQSITGTGVVDAYYDYGSYADGLWTKQLIGSETSLRYTQSWQNLRGETHLSAVSGTGGPIVTTTSYDPDIRGRVLSRTVPGEATTLYEYDPTDGSLFHQARDLNANGIIDLATDSITETTNSFIQESGAWFRQTATSQYLTDGSETPTLISTNRQQLNTSGDTASLTQTIDSQGNLTTRSTVIDRATRTVTTTTTTTDVPHSDLDAIEISIDGLPHSSTTTTVATPTLYSDYDALLRPTEITSPRGIISTTVYHPTTGQVTTTTRAGKPTTYTYHPQGSPGAGQLATRTLPDTNTIHTSYTLRGEVHRTWGSATYPTEYSYSPQGQRKTLSTFRNGSDWDGTSWPATTGTPDVTTWTYYPESGQLHQKIDAATQATTYTYHPDSGKMHTRTRARTSDGQALITTTTTYSPLGLPADTTHSDSTPTVSRTYDRAGRPATITDAAGTRTFNYPDLLTTTETISGGILDGVTRSRVLDPHQRLSELTAATGSVSHSSGYGYHADSRLHTVTTGDQTATYSYLSNSDFIETLTFTSGTSTALTTTRGHDSQDRLDSVSHAYGGAAIQSFDITEFDVMDRRKKIAREDGTRWDYGYNSKGEVTSGVKHLISTDVPIPGWFHGYNFDQIGNRTTSTVNGRTASYTPNALNQYESRTIPRAFDILGKAATEASLSVIPDPASGATAAPTIRLEEYFYSEVTTPETTATHIPYTLEATDPEGTTTRNGGKFLKASPEARVHDDDGNLTSDGRFSYTWDADNRLITMETHPTVPLPARRKLAFDYDGESRRIRKTVWHGTAEGSWKQHHQHDFIHELGGWNILAERATDLPGTFLRTYTWGTDLSGNMTGAGGVGGLLFSSLLPDHKTFAHATDLNGNVTLLVNTATTQSAAQYEYGPFGESLRQSGTYALLNPYRFSTKYHDNETGLLDYGYRYYDPANGRWPSRDPIEEEGGLNLYGFIENDGIGNSDMLGWKISTSAGESFRNAVKNAIEDIAGGKLCWDQEDDGNWYLNVSVDGSGSLWDDVEPALGSEKSVTLNRIESTDQAEGNPVTGAVNINEDISRQVPELDVIATSYSSPPAYALREADFRVVLWHELVGHAIKGLDHPRAGWNRYKDGNIDSRHRDPQWGKKGDSVIYIENQARAKLNLNFRAIWYYGYD